MGERDNGLQIVYIHTYTSPQKDRQQLLIIVSFTKYLKNINFKMSTKAGKITIQPTKFSGKIDKRGPF